MLRGPKEPFVRPATGLGGEGSLSILLVIWSPRGPRVPVARPGARWAADRSPDAARNATGTSTGTGATFAGAESQATKIARPNRFARPFGSIRPQPRRLVLENLSKRYDHRPPYARLPW